MIQAIIFDLGGTLLEFNPHHMHWLQWERVGLEGAHAYLAARGKDLDLEAFVAYFSTQLPQRWDQAARGEANLRLPDLLRETCLTLGATLTPDEVQSMTAAYIAPIDAAVAPYADTVDTLAALHQRGLKIGLISNTMWPGEYHLREMERFGLLPFFDHTIFTADVSLWKPQPEVYHLSLEALGVSAPEAVFVGDLPAYDILGAQRAGVRAVYKRNPGSTLDGMQPDAEIDDLAELVGLVEDWGIAG